MATINELKQLDIKDMDYNMYQKYKGYCEGQEFSPFAKFVSRFKGCEFYINDNKIAKCVAFANYAEQYRKAYMNTPEKLVHDFMSRKTIVIETYRYNEFRIVKKS